MTRAVVFQTPGLIDIRAFTHFGVNSKPLSKNPIGYFGTGLKMAIAVLVREGYEPIVWIGDTHYRFFTTKKDFRDKSFDFVRMQRVTKSLANTFKKSYHDLPFTTELAKNWELWQAFRELESNTRDEDGTSFLLDIQDADDEPYDKNSTCIVIKGEKFVQEWLDREKTFLPGGLQLQSDSDELQVFERPSKHIYYRGLRVLDLPENEPSQNTYNILRTVELTEDRTVKYDFIVKDIVAKYLASRAPKTAVTRAFSSPRAYERSLPYDWNSSPPSATFVAEATTAPHVPALAKQYVESHEPKAQIEDPFKDHPRPWSVEMRTLSLDVLDANSNEVPSELLRRAITLVNTCKPEDFPPEPKPTPVPAAPQTITTKEQEQEIPF